MTPEDLNEWLSMTEPHPTPGISISTDLKDHPIFRHIVEAVNNGYGIVTRLRVLIMEPGCGAIKNHTHRVNSIVWYPYDHAIGCAFDYHSAAGTKADTYYRIPPNVAHYVPANTTDEPRISVAMEVEEPYFKLSRKPGECIVCRKWRAWMPKIIRDYMDKRWPL